jgi:hypothetical protein
VDTERCEQRWRFAEGVQVRTEVSVWTNRAL